MSRTASGSGRGPAAAPKPSHRRHAGQLLVLLPQQALQAPALPFGLCEAPLQFCAPFLEPPLGLCQLRELRLVLVPDALDAGGGRGWVSGVGSLGLARRSAGRQGKASPALRGPLALLPGQRHVRLQPVDHQLDLLVPVSPRLLPQLPFPPQQPCFLERRRTAPVTPGAPERGWPAPAARPGTQNCAHRTHSRWLCCLVPPSHGPHPSPPPSWRSWPPTAAAPLPAGPSGPSAPSAGRWP